MSRLHPVFNAVKLRLAPPDPIPGRRARPPPPPTLIDDEEWFDVEDILDSRFFRRKLQYKVKWKGYGYEDASWSRWRTLRTLATWSASSTAGIPTPPSRSVGCSL
ncbi:putative chromo (CHRromatin Organisation MOdifier) domain containing protein [Lyophyllum shimeji]|uniref:Chromo (CHRromatin Organisation MOdifier) domain containing protein n=1 Tax=Lyophyllum shimeji TaxID=47721 RepID=A0A9P3UXB7_LYOSH|nr:putative chromo (CHRromatin Organisation MOdifier) domain containing protein [Lyophyllum shimeji]